MSARFIAIAGNIGAGKSTMVGFLSRKFGLQPLYEPVDDNPYIADFYEDAEIFVENLHRRKGLSKRDYNTYMELYHTIRSELQPPDLLIYLRCSVRGVRRRIKNRGRESEMAIPLTYIQKLHKQYEAWFEQYDLGPKAVIETEKLDYLRDIIHRVDFIEQIEQLLA